MSNITPIFQVEGPKNMPEGMDFWVEFRVKAPIFSDREMLNDFAARFEGSMAPYTYDEMKFVVPSTKANAFLVEARQQGWCREIGRVERDYSDGEYFNPSKPVGQRFLFGFDG